MKRWIYTIILIFALVAANTVFAEDCTLSVENGIKFFVSSLKDKMVVAVHGGLSSMEESYRFCKKLLDVIPSEYGIVSVDYSFSPLGDKEVEDVVLAVQWLKKKGVKSIGLLGVSHGAYIALLAGLYTKPDYVIDVAGPTEMQLMYAHFKRHPEIFKNWIKVVELTKQQCLGNETDEKTCLMKISPASYAGFMNYPILIVHGNLDTVVPINQSLLLYKKLLTFKNKNAWFVSYPIDHYIDLAQDPVKTIIQLFLKRYGGGDGVLKGNPDQTQHKALPEQRGGEGED